MRYAMTVLLACLLLAGCEPSPGEARQQLADLGVTYSKEQFAERAKQGDVQSVRLFLQAGMKPDARNDMRQPTPLAQAASKGEREVVRLLLDAGADPAADGGKELTSPFVFAVVGKDMEILRMMLEADPEAPCMVGMITAVTMDAKEQAQALARAGCGAKKYLRMYEGEVDQGMKTALLDASSTVSDEQLRPTGF